MSRRWLCCSVLPSGSTARSSCSQVLLDLHPVHVADSHGVRSILAIRRSATTIRDGTRRWHYGEARDAGAGLAKCAFSSLARRRTVGQSSPISPSMLSLRIHLQASRSRLAHRGSRRSSSALPPAPHAHVAPTLAGDWDAYVALGSTPRAGLRGMAPHGLRALRRARLERRRIDPPPHRRADARRHARRRARRLGRARRATANRSSAAWHGDTLTGVMLAGGKPAGRRIRLVRRATPFVAEQHYALWPGAVSDSQYAVTEDTLVFMTTRDGARLASYVARPVGQRAVRRRAAAHAVHAHSASSRPVLGIARLHLRRAARARPRRLRRQGLRRLRHRRAATATTPWSGRRSCPGANGRVGLIGHSDEGRLAWYAAVSAPPHLAAIAPSAATGDPWRIVPYEDMVFSPINVAWACLMRARTLQNISDLDIGPALDASAAQRPAAAARLRRRAALGSMDRAPRRSTRIGARTR